MVARLGQGSRPLRGGQSGRHLCRAPCRVPAGHLERDRHRLYLRRFALAAQVANKLADVYIAWQRQAALEQTKDATAWLNAQIEVLRPKLAEAEAAVEQFKASGSSGAEIKLRALEDEAKAERELLESYLARYRDASARHAMGAVPAQAAIVSRAHVAMLPSFPQRGPI